MAGILREKQVSDILPLFSTAASLKQGGLFLTEKAGYLSKMGRKFGPPSICDIAKGEGLKKMTLVESNFVNFFSAFKNLKDLGCDLQFGLKLVVCEDMKDKSETSFKTESKIVIFMKSGAGYEALCSIYSKAAKEGFYYIPRIDWPTLAAMWSDNLILALPFYSSFLAKNTLTFATIVPSLPANPVLLQEVGQELPFDGLLEDAQRRYASSIGASTQKVKSIYYKNRSDAKAFLVWRCALDRGSTFDVPNMEHMYSREFCWESFKELTT